MFKIQNKSGQLLGYSVLVIDIFVIRICFGFRYSIFGFIHWVLSLSKTSFLISSTGACLPVQI
ncbi:MAG: hypothetical protein KAT27_00710, partial [Desulfobacterales bacterium]|nr:hypothetical protein [Desulfobacterales bacterium]